MRAGIYMITNTANGKEYVGKDIRLPHRWAGHRCLLAKGKHGNAHLQRAWGAYGEQTFVYAILEYCDPEDLVQRESWWIKCLDLKNRAKGYNINDSELGRTGMKHTPEARRKMGRLGRKHSPEERARRSASMIGNKNSLGVKPTAETRAKLSLASRGNKHSTGYRHTEEAKAKISAAHRGNQHNAGRIPGAETRAKMSAAHRGSKRPPRSEEWRARQSETKKGKPWSEARRAAQANRKDQ